MCNTLDLANVKAVLPYWPRLYSNLATDIDYRVREAAQQAHRAIVMAVKRDIAPYLKQLMGIWFVSPFDSHPLAASIARTSFQVILDVNVSLLMSISYSVDIRAWNYFLFQTAFPPVKRIEAIVFAQQEILHYIARNIIRETPESLAGSK